MPAADAPSSRSGRLHRGDTYAALDLGTNNCRLLVARGNGRAAEASFQVIDAFSRIVRLGEGLAASGRRAEPAMARSIEALDRRGARLASSHIATSRMPSSA